MPVFSMNVLLCGQIMLISSTVAKKKVSTLRAVNDTAERAVKLIQDFRGLITVEEEQKQFFYVVYQNIKIIYPDCNKQTLKRKFNQ